MSATRCSNSRRAAGFTLLEVLVVLVIVGLVAASLFEALSRLNDVRGRLSPFLSASEREGLLNSWFRTGVNDLIPDKAHGPNVFTGNATSFSGLTLAPLAGDAGGPTPFKWELVYDGSHDRTVLRYTDFGGKTLELRGWRGAKTAFSYLGPDQLWYETWPPGLQKTKQLPMAIRLYAQEENTVIAAAIRGDKEPPIDPLAYLLGQ
jgi:prepilin-type N-terminal cleavage/methylation domain-containing protein